MSEEVKQEEIKNPIDCLFDEDNNDPIVLFNEKGEKVEFEQIAIIPVEERIFAILKPTENMEGIGEDEALVFEVVEPENEDEEEYLNLVSDIEIIDKVFDVYNVFPGEVISVSGNNESLEGYTVTIKHENDLTSTYSSLSSVIVNVGDKLTSNVKIGVSGTSVKDIDAGIHVHLTLMQNDEYINPKTAIGKEISEVSSIVK